MPCRTNLVSRHRGAIVPQGSLASLVIAAKILEPHLSELGASEKTVHVDNIMVGGKNEGEVQALLDALRFSLEKQPQESLRLTGDEFKLGDPRMDYLGYRLRREWKQYGGFGRAEPSRRSFEGLYRRCAFSLLFSHWRDSETMASLECAQWVRRFPHWKRRFRCEDLAFINILEDVDPAVRRLKHRLLNERMIWKSFAEFGADLRRHVSEIAQSTPSLFTVQPV